MPPAPRILLFVGVIASAWAGYSFGRKSGGEQELLALDSPHRLADVSGDRDDDPRRPPQEISRLFEAGELTMHEAWGSLERCQAQDLRAALLPFLDDPSQGRPAGFTGLGKANAMILFRWGQLDPKGAMDYAKSFPENEMVRELMADVFTAWWTRDPKGACDWAASDPASRSEHLSWVRDILGLESTEDALRRAHELGPEVLDAMVAGAGKGVGGDALIALGQAMELPAIEASVAKARNLAVIEPSSGDADDPFASTPTVQEPATWAGALLKLEELKLPPDEEAALIDDMILLWSEKSPDEVMKWVVTENGITGSPLQRHCMNVWFMRQKSEEALAWLGEQGDASSLYPGLVSLLRRQISVAREEDERGWSSSSTEEVEQRLEKVTSMWRKIDPKAEDAWRSASRADDLDASSGIVMDAFRFDASHE